MRGIIKLENLELISFDKCNIDHINFLKSLLKDADINKWAQGVTSRLTIINNDSIFNQAFFVSHNSNLVGCIKIEQYNHYENCVYLKGAINKAYRGQNYGALMLKEVSDYLFNNYLEIENIKLKISNENYASLKTAEKVGFKWLNCDYYIKENPNLKSSYVFKN